MLVWVDFWFESLDPAFELSSIKVHLAGLGAAYICPGTIIKPQEGRKGEQSDKCSDRASDRLIARAGNI